MECKICTPYSSENFHAKEISIDTGEGVLKIYPLHTDSIFSIAPNSILRILSDKGELKYKCNHGIIKIHSNKALIVVDTDEKNSM
ncbi:MAG: hypothetical protein N2657_04750 [bacterium]|nr:hypothetical protein [bacterium]